MHWPSPSGPSCACLKRCIRKTAGRSICAPSDRPSASCSPTAISLCYTLASTTVFGALFGFINSAQQVYVGIYGLGVWFPIIFAAIAGMMAVSSFLNSRLVGRFGMRRLSHGALVGFFAVSTIWFVVSLFGQLPLPFFVILFAAAMLQFGWIGSNFNALAMEPLGHIAGTASSVQGFVQTLGGGVIGAMIGQSFDGTTTPLAAGFCGVSIVALIFVLIAEKGKLFQAHHQPKAAGLINPSSVA